MAIEIEKLAGLERKIILSLPLESIQKEVSKKLRETQKKVKLSGFRPGKAPLKMVEGMYGQSIQNDVLNDKALDEFNRIVVEEDLKIAGLIKLDSVSDNQSETELKIAAIFDIYPEEISLSSFADTEIEKVHTDVSEENVDKTIDVLRKQRVKYNYVQRAVAKGDRIIIDFEGKIDDETFSGGSSKNYAFVVGEGQMLPEFEEGVLGMSVGEEKKVEVVFPEDYHGKDVAGKTAVFTILLHNVSEAQLPELDENFIHLLGVADGKIETLKEEIKTNLQREVKRRSERKTKDNVLKLLLDHSDFEVPSSLVNREVKRLREDSQKNFIKQGFSKDKLPELPDEMFKEQAEKTVKLGLIFSELVEKNGLSADETQIRAIIEDFAQNYEDPNEYIKWNLKDKASYQNAQALATENNVIEYVLANVTIKEKSVDFNEMMDIAF